MQQGDCNALATFMKLMNHIFSDMLGRSVYVYLDDILIFNDTEEDHIATIKEVCTRLRKEKLYVNSGKTMILPEVLDTLGHTITSQGLSAEPAKVLDVIGQRQITERSYKDLWPWLITYPDMHHI